MFKKIVSLVAVLALVLAACAFAATSPTANEPVSGELTSPVGADLSGLSIDLEKVSETALEVYNSIKDKNIADEVGDEFKLNAIANGIVPADVDFSKYAIDKFFSLEIEGYKNEMGDVEVTFPFVPGYSVDDDLLGAVGVVDGEDVSWTPVAAKANEDGSVTATFTEELADTVQNGTGESVFALLRNAD
ncbi:MAG: hypothetical protein IJ074_00875 [Clostridia bacterium]|nr:hypothetical protein [Clostridia bacterium]